MVRNNYKGIINLVLTPIHYLPTFFSDFTPGKKMSDHEQKTHFFPFLAEKSVSTNFQMHLAPESWSKYTTYTHQIFTYKASILIPFVISSIRQIRKINVAVIVVTFTVTPSQLISFNLYSVCDVIFIWNGNIFVRKSGNTC